MLVSKASRAVDWKGGKGRQAHADIPDENLTCCHFNDSLFAGGWIGGIKGMSPGSATLSPPSLPLGLLRLSIFFFRARQFFSPFSPNAEPGPRLVPGSKIVGIAARGKL